MNRTGPASTVTMCLPLTACVSTGRGLEHVQEIAAVVVIAEGHVDRPLADGGDQQLLEVLVIPHLARQPRDVAGDDNAFRQVGGDLGERLLRGSGRGRWPR